MNFSGSWQSTALPDRKLVFSDNGTGYIDQQGKHFPYFRWWLDDSGQLNWQFYSDESLISQISRAHDSGCKVLSDGLELEFAHAPIPFGIKHFKRTTDA